MFLCACVCDGSSFFWTVSTIMHLQNPAAGLRRQIQTITEEHKLVHVKSLASLEKTEIGSPWSVPEGSTAAEALLGFRPYVLIIHFKTMEVVFGDRVSWWTRSLKAPHAPSKRRRRCTAVQSSEMVF